MNNIDYDNHWTEKNTRKSQAKINWLRILLIYIRRMISSKTVTLKSTTLVIILAVWIKYKEIIARELFPVNDFGKARLSVTQKAIIEFKKSSNNKQANAELMIFYVETVVRYTDCYGDIDDLLKKRNANFFLIVDLSLEKS
jgi:hypothetical protein